MGLLGQIYEDFYDPLKYWWITFWKFSPRATAPMLRYMSHISFLIEKVGKFFCFSFILCYIFQCFRRKKVCIFVCVDYQFSQFSSVAQLCPTLCNPMHCSMPGFPVYHQLPELTQIHVHWFGDASHLFLCHPLLLPPSIIHSIRVFSNESVLCIRWPKYWSFSFSIRPYN